MGSDFNRGSDILLSDKLNLFGGLFLQQLNWTERPRSQDYGREDGISTNG